MSDFEQFLEWRHGLARNSSFGLVNGCFEIFHTGHLRCILKSKAITDYTIIAVNTDDYIRRKKFRSPVKVFSERAHALREFAKPSFIFRFEEDTPEEIIMKIRPDVLVKGPDYCDATTPESYWVRKLGGTAVYCSDRKVKSSTILRDNYLRAIAKRAGQQKVID